ncbi:MAG: hypothetical protein II529_01870 [Erysipelotrichaceae bacterium]|nr:hypothetical protein [Erysipelotrichaceae bacterium]
MNIKKALSYAAFGFMFTLININLTLNSLTVNITPNFIGWILLFVGFDKFGKYVENKKYLKVLSLILIVLSAALWAIDLFRLDLPVTIVKVVTNVLSAIYIFGLFTILTRVAEDYHSTHADTIRYLKYINVILFLLLSILGLVADRLSIPVLAIIFAILGILALVSAIISMVVLFRLRKEINERPDPAPEA